MDVLKKNLWSLFWILFIGGFIFLCIVLYIKWDSIKNKYELNQISIVKLFSNASNSLFLSQEMMIDILGKRLIKEKDQQLLDDLLELNPSMIGFGLVETNGTTILASSNMDVKKLPNLRTSKNKNTRDSFLQALDSKNMILGRTYFFKPLNDLVIPMRKTIRDKDGRALYVMVGAMRIKGSAKLFNNLHVDKYNKIALVRGDDAYFQFVSADGFTQEIYKYPVPKKIYEHSLKVAANKYSKSIDELKNSGDIFSIDTLDRYNNHIQLVGKYDNRYGLWTTSQIDKKIMYQDFLVVFMIYISIFIAIHVVLFFVFKIIADSENKKREELIYQATHDSLATLPNRDFIRKHVDDWINEKQKPFSIIYIDIDDFKSLNDSYGHYFGDQVLVEISKRMKKISSEKALVARQGSDEFVIFSPKANSEEIKAHAKNLMEELSRTYRIDEVSFNISASIGIAKYPEHGNTLDELSLATDIAMFESKKQKNHITIFDNSMYKMYKDKLLIEHDLKNAFKNNEFFMVYQPQVDEAGKIYGVEALIRWNSQTRGFIPPDQFIPVAEASGFITDIGMFVIQRSLKEIKDVTQELDVELTLSLNISVKQFINSNFLNCFQEEVKESGFDMSKVMVEITESLFIEDIRTILNILDTLHVKGASVSLDDFGTGYSSLSMLRNLPIDELKIDKSFVDNIIEDKSADDMIKNIIAIGKNLDIDLIAEGVETKEQMNRLKSYGCKNFQGYYFSKPLKKDELISYIKENK